MATEFLTAQELKNWLSRKIPAADANLLDDTDATTVITEKESELKGLLAANGITVSSTRDDNPISYDIVKNIVRYGSAADLLQGIVPGMSAQDYATIQHWRNRWVEMRTELRDRPGILSDATFGTPTGLSPDLSNYQRGILTTDSDYIEPPFEAGMDF